jgi:hypothetical protein
MKKANLLPEVPGKALLPEEAHQADLPAVVPPVAAAQEEVLHLEEVQEGLSKSNRQNAY